MNHLNFKKINNNWKVKNMNQNSKTRLIWMAVYLSIFIIGGHFNNASAQNILGSTDSISDSLKYIGHSFVKIKTIDGTVVYIDPYAVNEYADSADIVLVTHEHGDHNELSRVHQKSTCQVIRSANAIISGVYQSFTIGNIKITAVAAYNSNHLKSQCVGYVVEFDGIKLYHAGDTGNITEMAALASQNITYALLPMDGIYTMTPEQATQAADSIQAKHDIPIHTMPPTDTYSDAIVARFTSSHKLIVRPGSTIELNTGSTFVEDAQEIPAGFSLSQNYPNPFNPSTKIEFTLAAPALVSLRIFDGIGREVAELVSERLAAGNHSYQWNASGFPSGIYFYRFQAGTSIETKKLVLVK
jgi:L-ascorbate metabolism protein UlaG (beta-lactamase superfamily)